jgi:hypothetical protein
MNDDAFLYREEHGDIEEPDEDRCLSCVAYV